LIYFSINEVIAENIAKDMGYSFAEDVSITGEVRDTLAGVPVSVQVLNPDGDVVSLAQLDVSQKRFNTQIKTGGPLWTLDGTYTAKVLYGSQSRTAETTFHYFP